MLRLPGKQIVARTAEDAFTEAANRPLKPPVTPGVKSQMDPSAFAPTSKSEKTSLAPGGPRPRRDGARQVPP